MQGTLLNYRSIAENLLWFETQKHNSLILGELCVLTSSRWFSAHALAVKFTLLCKILAYILGYPSTDEKWFAHKIRLLFDEFYECLGDNYPMVLEPGVVMSLVHCF
ncbi:hypothetical protein E2542_SST04073 [Spatholobus suberectus]|nr:hypothetical protein E2542_SST04073 [Spatholobus suberectus]